MIKNAIHGVGAMPPKGGNPSLSDFEVERAVVYIANQSGASFEEPKEPAGDAAADEAKPAETAAAPAAPTPAPAEQAAPAEAPAAAAAAEAQAAAPAEQAAAALDPAGAKLYKSVCFACHAAG